MTQVLHKNYKRFFGNFFIRKKKELEFKFRVLKKLLDICLNSNFAYLSIASPTHFSCGPWQADNRNFSLNIHGAMGFGLSLSRGMGILDLMQKQGPTTEALVVQWASPDVTAEQQKLDGLER